MDLGFWPLTYNRGIEASNTFIFASAQRDNNKYHLRWGHSLGLYSCNHYEFYNILDDIKEGKRNKRSEGNQRLGVFIFSPLEDEKDRYKIGIVPYFFFITPALIKELMLVNFEYGMAAIKNSPPNSVVYKCCPWPEEIRLLIGKSLFMEHFRYYFALIIMNQAILPCDDVFVFRRDLIKIRTMIPGLENIGWEEYTALGNAVTMDLSKRTK